MWTEQTVETLRRLALEGRSAAWIAAALGAPSRSAVIGKANRIGIKLNGALRSGPIGDAPMMKPPPPEVPWGSHAPAPRKGPRAERPPRAEAPRARAVSRARSGGAPAVRERKRADRWLFAAAEVGEMRRIALADIGEVECRWPIGDPTDDDFVYCGLQAAKGHAYCAGHCRLAYRTPNEPAARAQNRLSWSAGFNHS